VTYKKVYSAKVDVTGVQKLELVTKSLKKRAKCWTIWVNPKLSRN